MTEIRVVEAETEGVATPPKRTEHWDVWFWNHKTCLSEEEARQYAATEPGTYCIVHYVLEGPR